MVIPSLFAVFHLKFIILFLFEEFFNQIFVVYFVINICIDRSNIAIQRMTVGFISLIFYQLNFVRRIANSYTLQVKFNDKMITLTEC